MLKITKEASLLSLQISANLKIEHG